MSNSVRGNKFDFLSQKNASLILLYKECLEKFSSNFQQAVSLETKSPIFLDTNVLLRYYSISLTAREKLFQFIDSNKTRIVVTPQIQYEFVKNRENVIQLFFEQVTKKIQEDFNNEVLQKMKSFLDDHKIVLKDHLFVEAGVNKHKDELEKILIKLNENVESRRKELANLITKDKLLDLLCSCLKYEGLTESETTEVKNDFDLLTKNVQNDKVDSILNKTYAAFPGLGDLRGKPDDPHGDYIIFHEIMKFMTAEKTDAIFLTFDNSKGDWMTKTKTPHLHYILNVYANTGKILYIVDAERTLEKLLDVNIESLVSAETDENLELPNLSVETSTISYLTWDSSKWNAKLGDVNIVRRINDVILSLSEPMFYHTKFGTHTSRNIDFLNENGEKCTAICNYHLVSKNNVSFSFSVVKEGESEYKVSASIRILDWDKNKWEVTIEPVQIHRNAVPPIVFRCTRLS